MDHNQTHDKSAELRQGVYVFAGLLVLTVIEYFLGAIEDAGAGINVLLWLVALIKGGLVLWYFMHVIRVLRSKKGHD
jgi:heme/copper-type cytochrome/quinol oxidase subunit 4